MSESSDHEEPIVKRRRMLKETMADLRNGILAASQRGHWYSESAWSTDSVAFLTGELMQVVSGIIADETAGQPQARDQAQATGQPSVQSSQPNAGVGSMLNKIAGFYASLFLENPMYEHLHHFAGTFNRLVDMGGKREAEGQLIETLASLPRDAVSNLDMSGIDVVVRSSFRQQPLFRSY